MNYKSWDDEGLRRVLIADPDDTAAICEAAERFAKQPFPFEMPKDVGDVCSGFPDEDFAYPVLKRLREFAEKLKGSNKIECQAIVTALEDLEQEVSGNTDYGRSELRKLEDALAEYAESTE